MNWTELSKIIKLSCHQYGINEANSVRAGKINGLCNDMDRVPFLTLRIRNLQDEYRQSLATTTLEEPKNISSYVKLPYFNATVGSAGSDMKGLLQYAFRTKY